MDYRNKNFDDYKNYYELDIDNFEEIRKELEITTIENVSPTTSDVFFFGNDNEDHPFLHLPKVNEFRKKLSLPKDTKFMLCHMREGYPGDPHIDDSDLPWSILFPIKNYVRTKIEYYTSPDKPIKESHVNEIGQPMTFWNINVDNLTLTDSFEIKRPTIMHNQRIHKVENIYEGDIWIMSFVLCGLGWDPMLAENYFYS